MKVCCSEHASIPSDDYAREFRALRDQQRILQASSVRIEEMIKSFTSSNKENTSMSTKQSHIPRALSVSNYLAVLHADCS